MGIVTVTGFTGFEVRVAVVISDSVSVLVLWGDIGVGGFFVCGRGSVCWWVVSNNGCGDEGKEGNLRYKRG